MSDVVVKEEAAWEREGEGAGAPWAALYAGHKVKLELVLGPETIQAQDGDVALPVAYGPEANCSTEPKEEVVLDPWRFVSTQSGLEDPSSSKDLSLQYSDKQFSLKPCYVKLERIAQKKQKCPICQKALKYNMKCHILTHTQEEIDTIKIYKKPDKHKKFKCHICGGRFTRKCSLGKHLRNHKKQDPFTSQLRAKIPKGKIIKNNYTCDICGKQISRKDSLVGHLAKHEKEGPFPCGVCKKQFKASWELVEHIKLATCTLSEETNNTYSGESVSENVVPESQSNGVERVSNGNEGKIFKSADEATATSSEESESEADNSNDEEFTLETDEEMFYCGICEKQYDSSLGEHKCTACKICKRKFKHACDLAVHVRIHTGETPFSCKICKKRFRQSSNMYSHIQRAHTDEKPHPCEECGKRFANRQQLNDHNRVHTGEKPFSCKVCNKQFRRRSTLAKHKLVHTGELPFACEFCPKRCRQRAHLISHRRIHTGEKPYPCKICGKMFSDNSKLALHNRIHTGEKPYSCDLCAHAFRISSGLVMHKRIHHTGEKPFKCKVCEKRFARKSHLTEHVESHTRDWAYACDICPRRFQRLQYLRHHEKRHRDRELHMCDLCGHKCASAAALISHARTHNGGQ